MGLLRKITDAVNRQLFSGVQGAIVPRGNAIPLDPFALGQVRFGRKIESVMPLLVPENRFRLGEDALFQMDRIVLDRESPWMEPGGYIYIGKRELHEIEDISGTTVILKERLLADHLEGDEVFHYSNPVTIEGNYVEGAENINIDTTYFIARGDRIAVPTIVSDRTLSFVEYTVSDFTLTSTISGVNQYFITLDHPLSRDLEDGEVVQLRAFLSYKSKIITLPVHSEALRRLIGPYLLDWVSATFINNSGLVMEETMTIQRYDIARNPIGLPEVIDKNYTMLDPQIEAEQFLFWDRVEGDINYDGELGKLIIRPTAEGRWWLKFDCVPKLTVPFSYASGSMVVVPPADLVNNDWFRIFDGIDATLFEYKVSPSYVPTASSAATGSIKVGSVPTNNQWFYISDGFGKAYYFEFKADASTFVGTSGYIPIDVTTAVFAVDVTAKIVDAVNRSGLGITAARSTDTALFTNNIISLNGNQTILLDPTLPLSWIKTGMIGGTDRVITIDVSSPTVTTDNQVAILTSAAINQSTLLLRADNPGTFNSFRIFNEQKGSAGNIPITYSISSTSFLISGMSGGGGGMSWSFDMLPDQEIKVRVRLYPNDWLPVATLPAGVTSTVSVDLAATDQEVERIDLLVSAPTTPPLSTEILMGPWQPSFYKAASLSYEYVAQMYGDYTFASTTMWAKPLIFSLDDVRSHLDRNNKLDEAWIRL